MRVIHVLRKPLSESTVAANTLKHGCGGLNINASRVAHGSDVDMSAVQRQQSAPAVDFGGSGLIGTEIPMYKPGGRWPANVILQHLDGCRCDGVKRVVNRSGKASGPTKDAFGDGVRYGTANGERGKVPFYGGKETVANWVCEPGCPVARLDEDTGSLKVRGNRNPSTSQNTKYDVYSKMNPTSCGTEYNHDTDSAGGASRFYKQVGGSE